MLNQFNAKMDNNRYNGGQSSNGNLDDGPGPIPDRWLSCPRISSKFIENKFVAFKTPLSARYSPQMSPENHFPPEMVFSFMKMEKVSRIHAFVSNFCSLLFLANISASHSMVTQ